ncbi:serine hydrolase domain-containing protein [Actinopolymorpha pittospori]
MFDLQARLASVVDRHRLVGASAAVSLAGVRQWAVAGIAHAGRRTPITRGIAMPIASLTKPIVATAAAVSLRSSRDALDRPVVEHLPELRARWRISPDVTTRQLLSHTSGLLEDSLTTPVLAALGDGDDALTRAAALVVEKTQAAARGDVWQYYNGNYYLAGTVLAHLWGDTFETGLRKVLLDPAGMHATDFTRPDDAADGHGGGGLVPREDQPRARRPAAGLWSTSDDLMNFAEFLLDDPALTATVTTQATRSTSKTQYALGWEVADGVAFHHGTRPDSGYRSLLLIAPRPRFAAAILVNDEAGERAADDLLADALTECTGLPSPWPK